MLHPRGKQEAQVSHSWCWNPPSLMPGVRLPRPTLFAEALPCLSAARHHGGGAP